METYRTWMHLFELLPYYSWIVDLFHISTTLYQRQVYGRIINFNWLEERLKKLNFRLIFITRSADSFTSAQHKRLQVSGNPGQYQDLSVFITEQETYRTIINNSSLMTLEVDISDNQVDRAVNRIADWVEATGGLWAADNL